MNDSRRSAANRRLPLYRRKLVFSLGWGTGESGLDEGLAVCGWLVLGFKLGLQLAVGGFFEVEFQPLAAFAARIAGAGTVFLEASAKKKDSFGIVRIPIEERAKGL